MGANAEFKLGHTQNDGKRRDLGVPLPRFFESRNQAQTMEVDSERERRDEDSVEIQGNGRLVPTRETGAGKARSAEHV